MATILRGLLAAKKILANKVTSTQKGFLVVYVGDSVEKIDMVPDIFLFLNQPSSFQALLCKSRVKLMKSWDMIILWVA